MKFNYKIKYKDNKEQKILNKYKIQYNFNNYNKIFKNQLIINNKINIF